MTGDLRWRDQLTAYLREQANPPHKYGHQPRLYALTLAIAAHSPDLRYDDDVVFAAAFLHDLGVFIGHRPEDAAELSRWNHVTYTCEQAPALLQRFGFPAAKLPAVLDAIREHQPHDQPHSPESTLLRDADILEQLGAVGVLRTASKLGSDSRFTTFTNAADSLARAAEALPARLNLPAARALAAPRVAALKDFLAALHTEAAGHLE